MALLGCVSGTGQSLAVPPHRARNCTLALRWEGSAWPGWGSAHRMTGMTGMTGWMQQEEELEEEVYGTGPRTHVLWGQADNWIVVAGAAVEDRSD